MSSEGGAVTWAGRVKGAGSPVTGAGESTTGAMELLWLTWDDVDSQHRILTVRAAKAKNGESRSVPINEVLTPTLEAVRINSTAMGAVFLNRHDTSYRSFRTAFERVVRKADIADFTLHDFRHTFASRLVMAGVDLATVKELMGHKDLSMTLRYTHFSSDHKQDAVRKLEQFGANLSSILPTTRAVGEGDGS